MKIKKITSQSGNDFRALLDCEHCQSTQDLTNGYFDGFYMEQVIRFAKFCDKCHLNREGRTRAEQIESKTHAANLTI